MGTPQPVNSYIVDVMLAKQRERDAWNAMFQDENFYPDWFDRNDPNRRWRDALDQWNEATETLEQAIARARDWHTQTPGQKS